MIDKVKKIAKKDKSDAVTRFETPEDFVLGSFLLSIMHIDPSLSSEDVIKFAMQLSRKLAQPNMYHLWRSQILRIQRTGKKAEAHNVRRELFKMIQEDGGK